MSSLQTSIAQRKQKKMMVIVANPQMWTSLQLYTALTLTSLSAPVQFLGPNLLASLTNITDDNLGSGAILNADTDLAIVFGSSTTGALNNGTIGNSTSSVGELLRPLGKKYTIGTKVYGDLVTLQKVQRTDKGGSTTQGVPGNDTAFPQTAVTDGDGYGTFWVIVDSHGNAGPTNGNGRGSLTALAPVRVLAM
jgi:hypothetical protein